jgi:hypothetical protein
VRRGYHTASSGCDGRFLYIFGGISDSASTDSLEVLDTESWSWRQVHPVDADAPWPHSRFGHTSHVIPNELTGGGAGESLWVFGGGVGGDLLRDGYDLEDVWRFDVTTETWEEVFAAPGGELPEAFTSNVGRCHSSVLIGTRVLFFGGSKLMSATLLSFDCATRRFEVPRLALAPGGRSDALHHRRPHARFSALAGLIGTRLVITCGWSMGGRFPGLFPRGCLGDVWLAELAPAPEQRRAAQLETGERVPSGVLGLASSDNEGEEEDDGFSEEEDDEYDYATHDEDE